MAQYEHAKSLICEACEKIFYKYTTVFSVVNLDNKGSLVNDLLSENLNKFKCSLCGETFVYELPFLAYTLKRGYAILALPANEDYHFIFGKGDIFKIFEIQMSKFRLVNYQCEVTEKIIIFESGLDDYVIEYIKYKYFDKKYFLSKRDNILLFKEISDGFMIFEYRDFLGKVIETIKLPKDLYDTNIVFNEKQLTDTNKIRWQRVDTNYFKERKNAKEN